MTKLYWTFYLIWVFHRKVSFCKFTVRGPQSQKLSCHSTIIKPLLNASMPFRLLLTDNKHLETFKFSQNLQFPSSLPWSVHTECSTPTTGWHPEVQFIISLIKVYISSEGNNILQLYILLKDRFWGWKTRWRSRRSNSRLNNSILQPVN